MGSSINHVDRAGGGGVSEKTMFVHMGAHWAKMGLIFPRTPFPSGNSIYSKVKQIASFEK